MINGDLDKTTDITKERFEKVKINTFLKIEEFKSRENQDIYDEFMIKKAQASIPFLEKYLLYLNTLEIEGDVYKVKAECCYIYSRLLNEMVTNPTDENCEKVKDTANLIYF
jgi:hypothetical protein